jgi:hypothetical protein
MGTSILSGVPPRCRHPLVFVDEHFNAARTVSECSVTHADHRKKWSTSVRYHLRAATVNGSLNLLHTSHAPLHELLKNINEELVKACSRNENA